jgi:hypothetical protein
MTVLSTLNAILSVNFTTALIVASLVVASAAIFRETTDSNMMTAVFVPFVTFGALTSIYVLSQAGILFTGQKDANSVVSSGIGIIVAFIIMLAVIRSWVAICDLRRPPDASGRLLDSDTGT